MTLDLFTLTAVLAVSFIIQAASLFGQYHVNTNRKGPGWWALGSSVLALGFVSHALASGLLAIVASDALSIFGMVLLYVGVLRFFTQHERRGLLGACGLAYCGLIAYHTIVRHDSSVCTLIFSTTVALVSLLIARSLFVYKNRSIVDSAHFLAAIFLANGCFFLLRGLAMVTDAGTIAVWVPFLTQSATYLITFVLSTLWTFGFIILANQRLIVESSEAKGHFELIFTTSPDAILITRVEDGTVIDINDSFSEMTGFARADVIGESSSTLDLWADPADYQKIIAALGASGHCENLEASLIHKEGRQITGMVSAKIFMLQETPHMLGVIRDISQRKAVEKALEESHRKLEALSITDGLTGIANRRQFDEMMAQEHVRHIRSGTELSLIMLDIDYFKLFNDSYGHVAGDECLRNVARVMSASITRVTDLVARYGGEEFACILPETDRDGAVAVAERIRRSILALGIPHKASRVSDFVTASLGVITVKCAIGEHVDDLIAQADRLLYLAKTNGRNRVECHTAPHAEQRPSVHFVQLAWKDSFCSGNQLIDMQHQSLFDTANELLEAVLAKHPLEVTSALVKKLLDDIARHFSDEEQLLETAGFPGLAWHAAEHARLLAKGVELSREFEASTLSVGGVFQFLVYDVVLQHLIGADREFFPFVTHQTE